MSDVQTLKSYLVGLGFSVDAQQYKKFEGVLKDASKTVSIETGSIATSLVKWQASIVGMFVTVSTAILGTMDKVAMADQEYRLFGERMFMSTNNARSLKIALDALGQPMEAIAFDPELHERFLQLQKDQMQMSKGLGGDYESQMRGIRDLDFELTRLKVELQYLAMGTVSNIFKGLFGNGDVLAKMKEWNAWLINNLPTLSHQFADYLVPILKDTWRILKDVVELLGMLATEFTNVVGIFTNDSSLEGATFSFDKFAKAIEKVVGGIAWLLDTLIKLEKHLPILEILGGATAGGAIGSVIPGVGTGVGAVVGGGAAGIMGLIARFRSGDTQAVIQQAQQAVSGSNFDKVADAIEHQEGYFTKGTRPNRNNNPGDIEYGKFAQAHGAVGTDGRFAIFKDYAAGHAALLSLLQSKNYRNLTVAQAIARLGPPSENNTAAYIASVTKRTGLSPNAYLNGGGSVTIGDIHIMQPNASADEIANTIVSKVQQSQGKQTQRNLTELTPAFQ